MQNKYPLWKNLALIAIAIIGLIYAIPNLYSEDPVVQVSSDAVTDPQALGDQVRALLSDAKISSGAITPMPDGIEVRFTSPDTQLLARDVIKNGLGGNYTVALNLVPSTPAWLTSIRAAPMKQGLDLRLRDRTHPLNFFQRFKNIVGFPEILGPAGYET